MTTTYLLATAMAFSLSAQAADRCSSLFESSDALKAARSAYADSATALSKYGDQLRTARKSKDEIAADAKFIADSEALNSLSENLLKAQNIEYTRAQDFWGQGQPALVIAPNAQTRLGLIAKDLLRRNPPIQLVVSPAVLIKEQAGAMFSKDRRALVIADSNLMWGDINSATWHEFRHMKLGENEMHSDYRSIFEGQVMFQDGNAQFQANETYGRAYDFQEISTNSQEYVVKAHRLRDRILQPDSYLPADYAKNSIAVLTEKISTVDDLLQRTLALLDQTLADLKSGDAQVSLYDTGGGASADNRIEVRNDQAHYALLLPIPANQVPSKLGSFLRLKSWSAQMIPVIAKDLQGRRQAYLALLEQSKKLQVRLLGPSDTMDWQKVVDDASQFNTVLHQLDQQFSVLQKTNP